VLDVNGMYTITWKDREGRVAASASLASIIRFCAWYMSCLWTILADCIYYASAFIIRLRTNRLVQLSALPIDSNWFSCQHCPPVCILVQHVCTHVHI